MLSGDIILGYVDKTAIKRPMQCIILIAMLGKQLDNLMDMIGHHIDRFDATTFKILMAEVDTISDDIIALRHCVEN